MPVDPNEDFTAALAEAAGVESPAESTPDVSTEVSAGLTGLEEQPRDERGRFAGSPEPTEETPAEEAPEEGQAETEEPAENPALAAYLEKHGGDSNAALEALLAEQEAAQSQIGRQSSEVGELRNQLNELQGYVQGLGQQQPEALPNLPTLNDEIVEGLESLQEQRGTRGMMEWVVDNRPDLIDAAEQVWAAEDPVGAAGYRARREFYTLQGEQEQAQPQEPQIHPALEPLVAERALISTIDQAQADLGIAEADWPAIQDHLVPAMEDESVPDLIKRAVASSDPAQQLEGMKSLIQVARSRAVAQATADATQQASQAAAEQAAGRKKAAQVVTGSLRPTGASTEGQPTEMTSAERKQAFKERLMKTEVTSVADGLTGLS